MAKDPSDLNNHYHDDNLSEKIDELKDEIKTFEVKQEKTVADLNRRARVIVLPKQ